MKTLIRETYVPSQTEEDYNEELYTKMEKLGYNIPIYEKEEQQQINKYLSFLNDIDIQPFKGESVKKYKNWTNRRNEIITAFIVVCSIISWLAIANIFLFPLLDAPIGGHIILSILTSVFPILISLGTCTMFDLLETITWKIKSLHHYDDRIPEFAMQTCVDIEEKAQEYGFKPYFHVCYATKIKDPFLVVSFDDFDKYFYVEVWKEPGFKQEREV